jgi:taurine dioxygenase
MELEVTPTGEACGAVVRGVDLSTPLDATTIGAIGDAWHRHHVLVFPDQRLTDDQLESFTLSFGQFGEDPYIESIDGHEHVIAVHRAADETAPVFATSWHSDWSFQPIPPAGTCLYSIVIPPVGGDTLFANQHLAAEMMPDDLAKRVDGLLAVHSAGVAYGRGGIYGDADEGSRRAMRIVASDDAEATELHPLVCRHPGNGRRAFLSCAGYIKGIDGMNDERARELLVELHRWQTRPEFQYRHRWEPHMLVMWDNRSVLHMATGGYDGHERLLHRTTIAGTVAPAA